MATKLIQKGYGMTKKWKPGNMNKLLLRKYFHEITF